MKGILIAAAVFTLAVSAPIHAQEPGDKGLPQAQTDQHPCKACKLKGGPPCKDCKMHGKHGPHGGGMIGGAPHGTRSMMKKHHKVLQGRGGGGFAGPKRFMMRGPWGPMGGGGGHGRMGDLSQQVMMKGHMLLRHRGELKLTPEQQDKIEKTMRAAQKKSNSLKADIENLQIDIRAGMRTEKTDAGAVNRLIDKKYDAKAKLAKVWVDAQAQMQSVLNKEQLDEIREFRYGLDEEDEDEGVEEEDIQIEVEIER